MGAIDRFTWLVVGTVTLLIIAALGSVLVSRSEQRPDLSKPEGVVTAYVQAIQAGNADQAWELLTPEAASFLDRPGPTFTKEDFRRMVDESRSQRGSRVRIVKVAQSGDTATVELEITRVSGDLLRGASSSYVSVGLRREGAAWRLTNLLLPWQLQ